MEKKPNKANRGLSVGERSAFSLQRSAFSPPRARREWAAPVQAKVVLALGQGETVTKAALGAEIHRTTIHKWINHDANFAAALHLRRRQP